MERHGTTMLRWKLYFLVQLKRARVSPEYLHGSLFLCLYQVFVRLCRISTILCQIICRLIWNLWKVFRRELYRASILVNNTPKLSITLESRHLYRQHRGAITDKRLKSISENPNNKLCNLRPSVNNQEQIQSQERRMFIHAVPVTKNEEILRVFYYTVRCSTNLIHN